MDPHPTQDVALIVSPPHVIAPDLGIRAIDVSFLPGSANSENQPLICLGGHPARECVIHLAGSGQTHDPVVEVDPTLPTHRMFVERIREVLDPGTPLQVSAREPTSRSKFVPFPAQSEER